MSTDSRATGTARARVPPGDPIAPHPILAARGIRKSFGGLAAVDVERLDVPRGAVVALIGPNGAGKTTFFNVVTGFERADAGSWTFEGHDVSHAAAHAITQAGMVRTFQVPKTLTRMTVLDNLKVAAPRQRGELPWVALARSSWRTRERQVERRAVELSGWVGLGAQRHELAGTLSGGQRKLLELARALMTDPKLLMLDEPTAGVNPALKDSLLDGIRSLHQEGMTVFFVEHDMDVVTSISDRVVCMAQGKVIADDTPAMVVRDPRVIDAYLGRTHAESTEAEP